MSRYDSVEVRFWAKVAKRGPEDCWLWTGLINTDGYGYLRNGGPPVGAHRISHRLNLGPIPSGMFVCHRCDVKLCVNPTHLFLGTPADNSDDKVKKGRARTPTGEANGRTKLTTALVATIRASTSANSELAKMLGVGAQTIRRIRAGTSWRKAGR